MTHREDVRNRIVEVRRNRFSRSSKYKYHVILQAIYISLNTQAYDGGVRWCKEKQ